MHLLTSDYCLNILKRVKRRSSNNFFIVSRIIYCCIGGSRSVIFRRIVTLPPIFLDLLHSMYVMHQNLLARGLCCWTHFDYRDIKGSVSSSIPCTCRLLANLCLSPFSWAMKMALTKANQETTRARHAGWNRPFKRVCNEYEGDNLCKTKWRPNGHFCGNRYQGRHRWPKEDNGGPGNEVGESFVWVKLKHQIINIERIQGITS